jgi:serine/threonine protein phosphatase PrpC
MLTFRHASRATQGGRQYQEDSEVVWPGTGPLLPAGPASPPADVAVVAVLADGMGGHAAGDVASKTICSVFLQAFLIDGNPTAQRLETALHAANEAVRDKARANPALGGMGATCVGLAVGQPGALWISVGDSPLWCFRGGELDRLNEDHSLAPLLDQMVASGQMSAEEAADDPRRHYLRSAVTGDDLELIDFPGEPLRLEADDIIVLASDGILTLVDEEIRDLVAARRDLPPGVIADAIIEAVMAAGDPHQDNTTVVVVKVEQHNAVST